MLPFQMLVYVKLSGKAGLVSIDVWARKKHNYTFIDKRSYSLYKSTSFSPGPLQDSAAVIRLPGRVMIQDSQTTLSYWTAPKIPGSRANKSLLYKSSGTQSAAQSQESRFHDTVRRYLGGFFFFWSQNNRSSDLLNGFLSACFSFFNPNSVFRYHCAFFFFFWIEALPGPLPFFKR